MTDRPTVQVSAGHYAFADYMSVGRWVSTWHQVQEILALEPARVLEIGVGSGMLRAALQIEGVNYTSADVDESLEPDVVASVLRLPFDSLSFDVVACFQVLEHLPYSDALLALGEIHRVTRRDAIISLPDASPVWRLMVGIPRFGEKRVMVNRPLWRPREHIFDGEHYWEIGARGYPLSRVTRDAARMGFVVEHTSRVFEWPYHRFMRLKKASPG